jgi:hypothetical protein
MLRLNCIRKAVLVSLVLAAPALADVKDLLGRVPGEANAIIIVDVDKLLASPLALKEGWAKKRAARYADEPLLVPPQTATLVLASALDLNSMQANWEVAVMELKTEVPLKDLARGEGGYLDKLGDKPAVRSPLNAFYVQLKPQVLGTVAPANRQLAARWARQKHVVGGAFLSDYLQSAAGQSGNTMVLMAIDLQDVTSPSQIKTRLQHDPLTSLEKAGDLAKLIETVASVKGLTLTIDVTDSINGKGVIDFGQDAAPLADVAGPLLLEILARAGAAIPDLADWQFAVKRNQMTFSGKLSREGFRNLLSLIEPPAPVAVAAAPAEPAPVKAAAPPPAAEDGKARTIAASQEYFKTVSKILDKFHERVGTGSKSASLADIATWLQRDARRIERLPLVDVDPDLVAFGVAVAARMKQASQVTNVGSMELRARTSGVSVNSSSYDDYDDDGVSMAQVERAGELRQAALEEKASTLQEANAILNELTGALGEVRAKLTQRYGVEF